MNIFMDIALTEAIAAQARGEVPVGAVIIHIPSQQVIARNGNRNRELSDPTAHAEILVIRQACNILQQEKLIDCALYVTLEPCTMCAGAIALARIKRLYYGAGDIKGGGVTHGVRFFEQPSCNHRIEVYDSIAHEACSKLLSDFFIKRRRLPAVICD